MISCIQWSTQPQRAYVKHDRYILTKCSTSLLSNYTSLNVFRYMWHTYNFIKPHLITCTEYKIIKMKAFLRLEDGHVYWVHKDLWAKTANRVLMLRENEYRKCLTAVHVPEFLSDKPVWMKSPMPAFFLGSWE